MKVSVKVVGLVWAEEKGLAWTCSLQVGVYVGGVQWTSGERPVMQAPHQDTITKKCRGFCEKVPREPSLEKGSAAGAFNSGRPAPMLYTPSLRVQSQLEFIPCHLEAESDSRIPSSSQCDRKAFWRICRILMLEKAWPTSGSQLGVLRQGATRSPANIEKGEMSTGEMS
jgi:hypothetical protein